MEDNLYVAVLCQHTCHVNMIQPCIEFLSVLLPPLERIMHTRERSLTVMRLFSSENRSTCNLIS